MKEFIEVASDKRSFTRRTLVYGVGINDALYFTQRKGLGKCPYYSSWSGMLERCYSGRYQSKKPTYIGCSVCPEWLVFSNFKSWMLQQDWRYKELDKDILREGNKIYSPDTCIFVDKFINSLLVTQEASRGLYKLGVSKATNCNSFVAYCHKYGKTITIGSFTTEDEAHEVYLNFKSNYLIEVANKQTDSKLREALIARATLLITPLNQRKETLVKRLGD